MLTDGAKKAFADLGCTYQPIALKYCFAKPEGIKKAEEVLSFCQFVKKAQDSGEMFYVMVNDTLRTQNSTSQITVNAKELQVSARATTVTSRTCIL